MFVIVGRIAYVASSGQAIDPLNTWERDLDHRGATGRMDSSLTQPGIEYSGGQYLDIRGEFDRALLRRAIEHVVLHEAEAMSMRVVEMDGVVLQRPALDTPVPFETIDLTQVADPMAAADEWMWEQIRLAPRSVTPRYMATRYSKSTQIELFCLPGSTTSSLMVTADLSSPSGSPTCTTLWQSETRSRRERWVILLS